MSLFKNKIRKYRELNQFVVQQIVIFFLLFVSFILADETYIPWLSLLILIMSLLSYYQLYKVYMKIQSYIVLEAETEAYQKQQQMQKEHLKAVEEERKLLLEYRNQLVDEMNDSVISVKNEDEAREKAVQLLQKHATLFTTDYCQNKIIDAIIFHKFLLAKSLQIKTRAHLMIPDELPLKDIDIMFLFTNILDNAIEACEKIPLNKRFIEMEGMVKANYLSIRVTNSKDQNIKLDSNYITTSKENKEEHGLGLQIIRLVCTQNQGKLKIDDHGEIVDVIVTLALYPHKRRKRSI